MRVHDLAYGLGHRTSPDELRGQRGVLTVENNLRNLCLGVDNGARKWHTVFVINTTNQPNNNRPLTYSEALMLANGIDPDYPKGSFEQALAEWLEMEDEG